jgi:hypothetical protein
MSESSIDPERAGRPRRQAQLRYAMGGAARGMHHANPVAPIKELLQLCGFVEKERQRRVPSCVRASLRTGNSSERRRVDVASGAGSSAARASQSPRARRGQPRRVAMIRTVVQGRRCVVAVSAKAITRTLAMSRRRDSSNFEERIEAHRTANRRLALHPHSARLRGRLRLHDQLRLRTHLLRSRCSHRGMPHERGATAICAWETRARSLTPSRLQPSPGHQSYCAKAPSAKTLFGTFGNEGGYRRPTGAIADGFSNSCCRSRSRPSGKRNHSAGPVRSLGSTSTSPCALAARSVRRTCSTSQCTSAASSFA